MDFSWGNWEDFDFWIKACGLRQNSRTNVMVHICKFTRALSQIHSCNRLAKRQRINCIRRWILLTGGAPLCVRMIPISPISTNCLYPFYITIYYMFYVSILTKCCMKLKVSKISIFPKKTKPINMTNYRIK